MSAPGTPVSKLASQASSAEPSPAIQALHQAQNAPAPTTLEMQRQLLQQKLAEQKNAPFTSPTDDMMTPCSKKLQNVKSKSFAKGKPKLLSKSFGKSRGLAKSGGLFGGASKSSSVAGSDPFGASDPIAK
ncbi:uncharacterized protein LAJ45_07918 [Morchella importuna]|uniref:uncharacterized protein n=1 Tax=Morchella importuna TaxID=1174673 RepID=UPI001E8E8C10|nr:uncharacterized protein LAJ45_07918 [Morchella importuna]KAH8148154.1 hypothetical protein LAJ45_07918 [Morchella importuna]